MEANPRPLDGITVIDLTIALSGPICTCMLADYGAHVIKVESTKNDAIRGFFTEEDKLATEASASFRNFSSINRNKDSVCMNLRDPECMGIFKEMLKTADILVSNFRPGTTKAMGIDYDTLKEINPRIICAEICAFREKGRENEPGYDVVVQAASGIVDATGYPDQAPCKPGPSLADMSSGLQTMQGILLALLEREKTGRGQLVKVRMQDAAMFMMAQYSTPLIDNPDYEFKRSGMAHIEATPSNGFKTKDGYVFTAPAGDKLWPIFCRVIGMPDLPDDPRFNPHSKLIENRNILYDEILGPIFLTKTSKEWYDILSAEGLPVSPISTLKQAWCRAAEQGAPIVAAVEHPQFGTMHFPGIAIELSETPGRVEKYAPYLGEHTEEILSGMGISDEKMDELENRGVLKRHRD